MITVVQYLVIAAVIGAVMFGIAAFVFGRGEQLAPLPARMSPVELPAQGLRGDHVRRVRFGLALRGYRMSDVDWALERLADEIDVLRDRLDAVTRDSSPVTGDSSQGSDTEPTGRPAGTGVPESGAAAAGAVEPGAAESGGAAAGAPAAGAAESGAAESGAPTALDTGQAPTR